jgi:hypothetical protein
MSLIFCLIDRAKELSVQDLYYLEHALEANAGHCATAWHLAPPAVALVDNEAQLPRFCVPVVFVTGDEEDPGALAVHFEDPVRGGPACKVYYDRASGLTGGEFSAIEAAGHEICEALVNPEGNMWADHTQRWGVQVAVEVSDPVQDTYKLQMDSKTFHVANFVTPQWFDHRFHDPEQCARLFAAGKGFDYAKHLRAPGEIGPSGYVVLREREGTDYRIWIENAQQQAPQMSEARLRAKQHPMSRTKLRGVNL